MTDYFERVNLGFVILIICLAWGLFIGIYAYRQKNPELYQRLRGKYWGLDPSIYFLKNAPRFHKIVAASMFIFTVFYISIDWLYDETLRSAGFFYLLLVGMHIQDIGARLKIIHLEDQFKILEDQIKS